MGAFEENNYTSSYLAQARQKMTTKGEHSRISEDEAIPTVLNSTHEPGVGQQTLPGRSCNGMYCTAILLLMVSCHTVSGELFITGSYVEFTMS